MTKPLSDDLRERLVSAVEGGQSRRAAVERFGIAPSTAVKWMNWWRLEGHVKPRPMGGDRHSHRIEAHAEAILGLIDEKPDMTLAEIAAHLEQACNGRFSKTAIWRLLKRHGMTFKKKTAHASEQQRPNVLKRRHEWFDGRPDLPPERLVFIDETGASTKMARLRGRAPRGKRCRAPVPHDHWKTTTVVGALRLEGMTVPMVLWTAP